MLDVVVQLRDMGVRIGSTTGYNDKMMDVVVPCAAEQGYSPDFLITPDAVGGKGRPWPFMVFRNMEALTVDDVHHVAKAGDTVSDIKEGVAAGVFSVGVVEGSSVMGLSEDEYTALDEDAREDACARVERVSREAGADAVIRNFEEPPRSCARSGRGPTGWLDPHDPLEVPRHQAPRPLATVAFSDKPSDKTPVGERPPVQKCSTRQLLVRDRSSFGQAALQNPSWRRAPCPKALHSRWQVLAGRLRCPKTLRSRRMRARA